MDKDEGLKGQVREFIEKTIEYVRSTREILDIAGKRYSFY